MSGAVERARADLEAGRPWMARDRLTSVIQHRTDDELVDLLAEVYLTMLDVPAAGALWFATGRDDEVARDAVAVWADRFPSDDARWSSIPRPLRTTDGSPGLEDLRRRLSARPRGERRPPDIPEPESRAEEMLAPALLLAGVLVLVAMVGIGLWTTWHWIWT
ncbi:hypothetical protein G7075_15520 [Phycicoccus sp. HDW14]|uniref:DUF6584 family protein n=1 Tax=Phycicoccus sp. HDW14 TaxID=2714941 RepID=UPI00140B14BF|nr:DUF6584 family protein [Phycicoccus sp. HDW14]QIM22223.1 hypothetical protein G7075_15520 [Phycicoccus sp. HDW14]